MNFWAYMIDANFLFFSFISLLSDFALVTFSYIIAFFDLLGEVSESSALLYILAYILIDWLSLAGTVHYYTTTTHQQPLTLDTFYTYTELQKLLTITLEPKKIARVFCYERL